nr:unnamed protein product [Callosobruchus analis]
MKRNSIRILGINEKGNENLFLTASEFFGNCLGIPCTLSDIDVSFRIGNTADKQSRPRVLLVTLPTSSKGSEIMREVQIEGIQRNYLRGPYSGQFQVAAKSKENVWWKE